MVLKILLEEAAEAPELANPTSIPPSPTTPLPASFFPPSPNLICEGVLLEMCAPWSWRKAASWWR